MSSELLLYVLLILCSILTGLIWVIQIVHYPSFHFISEKTFTQFADFHAKKISFIVIPLMGLELIVSFLLSWSLPTQSMAWNFSLINLFLNILIWVSTFIFSVPCHQKLRNQKQTKIINKLILTNWYRTFLWTCRLFTLTFLIWITT